MYKPIKKREIYTKNHTALDDRSVLEDKAKISGQPIK